MPRRRGDGSSSIAARTACQISDRPLSLGTTCNKRYLFTTCPQSEDGDGGIGPAKEPLFLMPTPRRSLCRLFVLLGDLEQGLPRHGIMHRLGAGACLLRCVPPRRDLANIGQRAGRTSPRKE